MTSTALTREQPTEAEKVIKSNYDESDYHVIEFNVSTINQEYPRVFKGAFTFSPAHVLCITNKRETGREQNCTIIFISLTNENHTKAVITHGESIECLLASLKVQPHS